MAFTAASFKIIVAESAPKLLEKTSAFFYMHAH
jgi:hypothetical protein